MKASLDTNVIIHFYRAGLESILFDFFTGGIVIYEQIRDIELDNHGKDILEQVDKDIEDGKIEKYTAAKLKEQAVFGIFKAHVEDNRILYGSGDLGEIYAMALAKTLGIFSLVTDDVKQGGPYRSLLNFKDEIMPFTFSEILILRYLIGQSDEHITMREFDKINTSSNLNWSFKSELKKFLNRFLLNPYTERDREWFIEFTKGINYKEKFTRISNCL